MHKNWTLHTHAGNPSSAIGQEFWIFSMFPWPRPALRPSFLPLPDSLPPLYHLKHHMHLYFPPSPVKIFRQTKRKRKECLRLIGIRGIGKTQSKFVPLTLKESSSSRLSSMILFPMLVEFLSSSPRLVLAPLNYTPLTIETSYYWTMFLSRTLLHSSMMHIYAVSKATKSMHLLHIAPYSIRVNDVVDT